jgi:acyl-CoA thioesterase FadM
MERIKIQLPPTFQFHTIISIRITDINYGGHVGNDTFLSLIHEARLQFLLSKGYSELNIAGASLIMADAGIEFKKELLFNQQVRIWVAADGFDKMGFDLLYKLEVLINNEWILAGKAKTGMLCFDYTLKKLIAVPQQAIDFLSK